MINFGLVNYAFVLMILSILFIWLTTKSMVEYKKIGAFLPFFFVGIALIFKLSFVLNEFYYSFVWGILEILIGVCFIGIIIVARRNCKWR